MDRIKRERVGIRRSLLQEGLERKLGEVANLASNGRGNDVP